MAEAHWCLIESDPGVFTELVKGYGCKGVQVEEVWSLDDAIFENLKPIHGLIFLFKWEPNDDPAGPLVLGDKANKIFFAQQVIGNACATQAILSVILNCEHDDLDLGKSLSNFKNFCLSFDSKSKGLTLTNCEEIRRVHNSFGKQTFFELSSKVQSTEEAYHFISYVPIAGRLYELDGLRDGPIDLGPVSEGKDWITIVKPVIENRVKKYKGDEIRFNLLAVCSDRKMKSEKRIAEIQDSIRTRGMETDEDIGELAKLQNVISEEEEKAEKYRIENIRRKHNYLPLIIEILKQLAKEKELLPLYQKAKTKVNEKLQAKT